MTTPQQILIEATGGIFTKRAPNDIEVSEEVMSQRDGVLKELGYSRNDPKIGITEFRFSTKEGLGIAEVGLAPGITKVDDDITKINPRIYPTGHPLEAFAIMPGEDGSLRYKVKPGAYLHASTFGLTVAADQNDPRGRAFDRTFALIVEKKGKAQQQKGSVSIPNQGIEIYQVSKLNVPIKQMGLASRDLLVAIYYDVASTLGLIPNQFAGYQPIGLAPMPGSVDIGGIVVVDVDLKELEEKYQKRSSDWKVPRIIPTKELSNFLISGDVQVNSLLEEEALGLIIHNHDRFGALYERALSRRGNA